MSKSSIPGRSHSLPPPGERTAAHSRVLPLGSKISVTRQAGTPHRAAVLYKMWSFGPSHPANAQPHAALMKGMPANRRNLIALRRKPLASKRGNRSRASSAALFDDDLEDYHLPEADADQRIEKKTETGGSYNSNQNQQNQGNKGGHSDEERKPLSVRAAHLRLAIPKPQTTFAMLELDADWPLTKQASCALDYFTEALLSLRDKAMRGQTNLKLRPLVQELVLCLLSNLVYCGTLPMTKLDAIRQYLIDADDKHEKNSSDQREKRQGQEKEESEKQQKEKEEKDKPSKKPAAADLPQSIKNLNLLTPLLILSSQHPANEKQLKLSCGRLKSVIRTATK